MSVLPYQGIGSRPELPIQRPALEPKALPGAGVVSPMERAEAKLLDHATTGSSGLPSRLRSDAPTFQSNADTRHVLRMAYRLGRLRGHHAAYSELWNDEELTRSAGWFADRAMERTGAVRQFLQQPGQDPFRRYLGLLGAQERLGSGNPEATQELDDCLDELWDEYQAEIVAGFNTAGPLLEFAQDVEQWHYFRTLYGNLMANEMPLGTVFKALLTKFGASRLPAAIHTLRAAIAADLASPIVSADRVRLEQTQHDLENTHTMNSLLSSSEALYLDVHGKKPPAETLMQFVAGVFDYVATASQAEPRFQALRALLLPDDPLNALAERLLSKFLRTQVPLGLWRSQEVRNQHLPTMYRRN